VAAASRGPDLVEINQERRRRGRRRHRGGAEARLEPAAARPVVDEGASRQSLREAGRRAGATLDRGTPGNGRAGLLDEASARTAGGGLEERGGQPRSSHLIRARRDALVRRTRRFESNRRSNHRASQRRPVPPTSPAPTAGIDVVSEARIVVSEQTVAAPADDGRARATRGDAAARVITPVTQTLERHNAPPPRPAREIAAAAAAGHEETIEISIGAINLHVEAPAPHTVVQPPPAPRARPAPERRAERSGLARRYLRPSGHGSGGLWRAIGAVTRLLQDHLIRRGFEVSVGKP
jgi:hypothetical protein